MVIAAFAMLGTTTATASESTVAARTTSADATAASCTAAFPMAHAKTNVKIRKKPKMGSTALRLWYKNTNGCASSGTVKGGVYTVCGGNDSPHWRKVKYRGTTGYVPMNCLRPGRA
ncbi:MULTISPECIES: hypothetical protein [Streptomyces]|uniref:SH3 domain-containing protein n=1 Tax=Streptomyces lonegramiae TaxID=3075524 RepID=A0ABU2XE46_9ACTN|nr:hypothetical protein [Streptomyces sp. DSM 41529]MDT0544107.1 hypothetical protein [Streptomyces sp. DSM 41529]